METLPDPRISDLLRVGKVRVALFLPLYKNDPITGEVRPSAPAIAMPKIKPGWLAYISEFVNEAKASGLVQRAIESTGAHGLQVARFGNA
jgi:hypothetical protein